MSQTAPSTVELEPRHQLTSADRCDSCGAQAYIKVTMASGELLFCAHHAREHGEKLREVAAAVHDETHKLDGPAAPAAGSEA